MGICCSDYTKSIPINVADELSSNYSWLHQLHELNEYEPPRTFEGLNKDQAARKLIHAFRCLAARYEHKDLSIIVRNHERGAPGDTIIERHAVKELIRYASENRYSYNSTSYYTRAGISLEGFHFISLK